MIPSSSHTHKDKQANNSLIKAAWLVLVYKLVAVLLYHTTISYHYRYQCLEGIGKNL